MRTTILAVVAATVAGCAGGDANDWPAVEALYSVNGQAVSCAGTSHQGGAPEAGPFTTYTCSWNRVTLHGEPQCSVMVWYTRADAAAEWSLVGLFGSGPCD